MSVKKPPKLHLPWRDPRPDLAILVYMAVLLVLVWSAVFLAIANDLDTSVARVVAVNDQLAISFEDHIRHILREADQNLRFIKADFEVNGAVTPSVRRLVKMQIDDPLLNQSVVTDEQGTPVVSAIPTNYNLSSAPQFRAHVAAGSGHLFIGPPRVGRISGAPSIHLSRRLNHNDGSFAGMVSIAVAPPFFIEVFRDSDQNSGYFANLVGLDRIVRATRHKGLAPAEIDNLFAAIAGKATGHFEAAGDPASPGTNFHSYRVLPDYPLAVQVGVSRDIILAGFFQRRNGYIAGGAGVSLLILLYSGLLMNVARRQRQARQQLDTRTRELEAANTKLEALALADGLTGLANRRSFELVVKNEWRRAIRDKRPLALVLADIDRFKKYNDTFGHQAGDDCLRKIGRTIAANMRRPGDFAARYGGEEFVLVLANIDRLGAAAICEQIRKAVEDLAIPTDNGRVVTVSLGAAVTVPAVGDNYADLLRIADEALYRAKRSGRNRVMLADADAGAPANKG